VITYDRRGRGGSGDTAPYTVDRAAVAEGRPADAIALFLADSGLPTEVIEQMSADPRARALAVTMPYDFAVVATPRGAARSPRR